MKFRRILKVYKQLWNKNQESSSLDTQINDKKRELEMLTKGVIEKNKSQELWLQEPLL